MSMDGQRGLIEIKQPIISNLDGKTRLSAVVVDRGTEKNVWFDVEAKYGSFLCSERSDAFLIGILNYAMRNGCDITCEAPVGAQLLYQIRTYLIPSLARNSKVLHAITIQAEIDAKPIVNAGGVGAGISCGIDSLHVFKNYSSSIYPGLKLTHLILNNVGAFGVDDVTHQYDWQVEHAKRLCREYGMELIQTNSNFASAVVQEHLLTHTYSSCFAVYALQKLWDVYFYGSSGHDYQEYFSLKDSEKYDAARYELLSLDVFSTRTLKIYSEGAAVNRFEKTKALIDYEPAQKYLHVCLAKKGGNCGVCSKCCRTLVTLDALGALDAFSDVFNVEDYRCNRRWYLRWMCVQVYGGVDTAVVPAYNILKKDVGAYVKLEALIAVMAIMSLKTIKRILFIISPSFYAWIRRITHHF